MNGSASGQLVTFIALLSHSIFFPTREATLPSSTISVSGPAYPKWLPVALPVLHAWIHSAWWPGEFGIVGSGGLYPAKSFSGSSLYRSPYEPARYSLPFSPISSEPLSTTTCPSNRSLGGFLPPSYQVNFTGGMSPLAGNS